MFPMRLLKRLTYLLIAILSCAQSLAAQNQQQDSLVILLSSKSAQMVDVEGARFRKIIGPARFLHNGTYLLCDTAYWNVETKVIDAWGNVSILQDETVLTSDHLKYLIDEDLAQFRGSVVQLTDKDHNTLRTRHLDYNTADSVAVFQNGGAMRDKDGQIIESRNGTYDSKIKTFTFENNVNMFTDSIFVKTRRLVYESDYNLATFGFQTDVWQEDNMLSANSGWYDRGRELFFFTTDVHIMSEDQEGWCDSLYFYRETSDVNMLGNAQITDTTRNVYALAGSVFYEDTLSRVTLTRDPAVISQTEEADGSIDTVYLGADKLVYYTLRMFEITESQVKDSKVRLKSLEVDPVGEFRKKAAAAAAKVAEEAAMQDPNYRAKAAAKEPKKLSAAPPLMTPGARLHGGRLYMPANDTLAVTAAYDSVKVSMPEVLDSSEFQDSVAMITTDTMLADTMATADTSAAVDSIPPVVLDSTRIGFLEAIGKVKIYKKHMQVACDSLLYSDLDSLARLFKEPLVWQDLVRQYSADSISIVVRNGGMDMASLMSNAFIVIQEDEKHFDQIKGTEMLAFFDDKGTLKRFDVLGGASALFYLEENDALATVNKTESKMLSATFKDGEIQRIYYYETAKNDGYPIVQLSQEDRQLKGFNWQPDRRPADRNAVTPLSLRPSERKSYASHPKATYSQTDIYFPGYMSDIYRQIKVRDSLRVIRQREAEIARREAEVQARLDSLRMDDSLAVAEPASLVDSVAVKDSLVIVPPAADTLTVSDSTMVTAPADTVSAPVVLTPEQIKAAEKAALKAEREKKKAERTAVREAKKKKKQEEREARWAELDRRDAEKLAAKEAEKLEKERKKKRKAIEDAARQEQKDNETLEKYIQMYQREKEQKSKKAARN